MSLSLRQRFALFRWRLKARKKNCVGLRVSDVPRLMQRLEEQEIPAVVLRWFDEVPRTPQEERRFTKDVDMLIDGSGVERAVALAAEQPGPVRCDVYSDTGQRGSTYSGMPYYPPMLAQELLRDRELYDGLFHVPRPDAHFRSLLYHLVYHKGLESGIPSGCHLSSTTQPKRNYAGLLVELAQSAGVVLMTPITLLSLHEQLQQMGWNMPLDLLARWPRQTAWHEWLLNGEKEQLRPWAEALPQLLVFFIRDDVASRGLNGTALDMLAEKFSVLATEQLSHEQTERVLRQVRGGDWVHYGKSTLIPPRTAVVCYDLHPVVGGVEEAAKLAGRSNPKAYPLVENANVLFKHEIRRRLQQKANGPRRIHGLHGGDNAYESQHMLRVIYGAATDRMNAQFLAQVNALRSADAQRRAA